ncbi:HNH endonuclease [Nocardioides nematodiphilus]|uniref:HNH endonuclease n=1 Tax=Nocardioides nematodiphilus TaxID=2849669 RepID=UPI001CD95B30|nr:HNH endonuclease [Nocardioides nematodiphilus]MCA1984803.1 HNH endonuclease [Nocardioides nematodiphilus]
MGHIKSRATHPELTWEPSNWRAECRPCSDSSGQATVIEKAKAEAVQAYVQQQQAELYVQQSGTHEAAYENGTHECAQETGTHECVQQPYVQPVFPGAHTASQSPPLPVSLPGAQTQPDVIREELTWADFTQNPPAWCLPLPTDQEMSPPRAMTPVHPDAVGSYGPSACDWIENQFGQQLRPWQRLAICRALEHRADGSLCWKTVILSASRRSGKSIVLRGLACWRMQFGIFHFGEPTEIVHTGNDLAIVREVQRTAWPWATETGWTVARANGKEAIENTDFGDRWLARAKTAVYGYSPNMCFADEAWDINPDVVDDGLTPSLLERSSPQLWLVSTAHRRATSLMRKRISAALAEDDGSTLLLWWGAGADADPGDENTWRAASPHWTQDRLETMRAKYATAVAGEEDPEADDLDPMEGFKAQYLNQWQLRERKRAKGEPVIDEDAWEGLAASPQNQTPVSIAIESQGDSVSVACAWQLAEGPVLVSVSEVPTLAAAAAQIRALEYRGRITVGLSLKKDPAFAGLRLNDGKGRAVQAIQDVAQLLREGQLRHDGGEHLSGQILGARTLLSPDGIRLVSAVRTDAIKAASWAVQAARKPAKARRGFILPSSVSA